MADNSSLKEYIFRVNKVLDHIDGNLCQDLNHDELADIAGFSRFHFHRLFRSMLGETLGRFLQRVRIEKAACMLRWNSQRTITSIAMECGFSGSAVFSRSFRDFFGMSPSSWRRDLNSGEMADSNICKMMSNDGKDCKRNISYPWCRTIGFQIMERRNIMVDDFNCSGSEMELCSGVEVRQFPCFKVAYVRHIGPYKGDSSLFETMFGRLFAWAGPRGLLNCEDPMFLIVYHDDPNITEQDKLRISVCLRVDDGVEGEGDIGSMHLPGGEYCAARFDIRSDQFQQAWEWVCGKWLPNSGYQPDDRPCFELCLNDPSTHPEKRHVIEICVPVKPL